MWNNLSNFKLKGNYQKGKIEKSFQKEIFDNLRKIGYICYHIADIGYSNKFLDRFIINPEGEVFFIEFKKIKLDSFNISQFEDSQILLLPKLDQRNPDRARVFIYSEKHKDYKVYTFSELWNLRNEKGGIKIFNNKE